MLRFAFSATVFCALTACNSGQKMVQGDAWMLQGITRTDEYNPIMEPDAHVEFRCPIRKRSVHWAEKNVFNPAAVVRDDRIWLLFRAQDATGCSRIGLAESKDGYHFKKQPDPALFPDNDLLKTFEWEGGCEDPRIVRSPEGLYIMTYTAYDKSVARLCVASSKDLQHWNKHGLMLSGSKYRNHWSKSGAIVCEKKGEKIVAKKIQGKYWMYWGDTDLFMATSLDLIHWEPMEDKNGNLIRVMSPRQGFFDSRLVEPGPFALLRKEGILLLYNSANSASSGDKTLGADVYSAGQALFAARKPEKLIGRSNRFFLSSERYFEKEGSVSNVCFVEGMVWFKDRWLIYYGAGDSRIAVAECKGP